MKNCKICKSSQNLRLERNISNTLYSNKTNNLTHNQNTEEKNILLDFISSKKKMTLESCFDYKGSKKFLSEKEKAMAFLELPDDIIEEKKTKKRKSKKETKRNTKHRSESQKALQDILIKRIKFITEDRKELKKKMMSDKNIGLRFAQNYKKYKKKPLVIKSDCSDIKGSDSLNLASDHNDSLIQSILKEMIKY
jgi:hypothetical protein